MACYHPNTALWYGDMTAAGKRKYYIIPQSGPTKTFGKLFSHYPLEEIEVPCGKCIGCRLDYSRQWANRCMLEAKQWQHNYMITLTYDESNVHLVDGVNRETGELQKVGNLEPKDLTKFMKDLRRYYMYHYNHDNIRFYACGEYGDNTYRPHYHVIVFNCPILDLENFFLNKEREQIYLSNTIRNIWKKGIITVAKLEWQVAAYVARYVMKKRKGKDSEEYYKKLGVIPEFVRMSRGPGIARDYYEQHKDQIYEFDEIHLERKNGQVMTVKPSKYYDRLYDLDSPEALAAIKKQRKLAAEISLYNELHKTNLNKVQYLELKEKNKIAQTKTLLRTI